MMDAYYGRKISVTPPLRENLHSLSSEICTTLRMIFWEHMYATKAIQQTLGIHSAWEEEQRALFSETVYDITRWWRPLWYIIDIKPTPEEEYLQKLITIYLVSKKGDITALQKRKGIDAAGVLQRIHTIKTSRALRESIPDWLDELGVKELGSRWDSVIASLNKHPDLIIRVNTLKINAKQLSRALHKEGVIAEPLAGNTDALFIKEKTNVFRLKSYDTGLFEVQDAASQMASRMLNPQAGTRVIDACAGEGSKTLHLAALIGNKGKIIALDTQEWKLKELRRRAKKAGADTIETRQITSSKIIKRMKNTADRLLLDVPCSGLGTLQRNPDIKWKLTIADLDRLRDIQHDLLDKYCTLLKPEGTMVYSVCSILPSEGKQQIQEFLSNYKEFHLLEEKRYWPDKERGDGFYIAHVKRIS